eukprot:m.125017 g.125017  ORF g.125017 m.125017 type:complete len:824 (+) comp16311_c0_seq1:120-2591(+)
MATMEVDNKIKAEDSDDEPLAARVKAAPVTAAAATPAAKPAVAAATTTPAAAAPGKHAAADDSDDDVPLAKRQAQSVANTPKPATTASATTTPKPNGSSSSSSAKPSAVKAEANGKTKSPKKEIESAKKSTPVVKKEVKKEADDDDDKPLSSKLASAKKATPSGKSQPPSSKKATPKSVKKEESEDEDEEDGSDSDSDSDSSGSSGSSEESDGGDDDEPVKAKKKQQKKKQQKKAAKKEARKSGDGKTKVKTEDPERAERKRKKKEEEEQEIWKWWLDPELPEGQKWRTLEHKGPMFPPEYTPLPAGVHMLYDGVPYPLKPAAEEVAGFYAVMLNTDYMKKKQFNDNFWKEWRDLMTKEEKAHITKLENCDFTKIQAHYAKLSEEKKAAPKEVKDARKAKEKEIQDVYGYCMIDGHRQKIGNFRIEPPGLFRGRGEHPKMGLLKRRVRPEDVTINCSKESKIPEPPPGHKWKEVKHDNTVTWLAGWTENVQSQNKYVMLASESHLKGRSDFNKYETARMLKKHVHRIREDYTAQLKSKEMYERQRATALYLIDKLALRAGGEKDAEEQADTVGCCNLRLEHVNLLEGDELELDFLGKDSIRYYNRVKVENQVWKNIRLFMKEPKVPSDDLFDRLTTQKLNAYLHSLMPGLTAKVFRTYNASITLQEQLKSTPVDGSVEEKMLAYNRSNREVAVLCNHQRAPPKTHDVQVGKMQEVLGQLISEVKEAKAELKAAKAEKDDKKIDKAKKKVASLELRLHKKEIAMTDKQENKTIALSTSKLNYLDPRISVAWCKRFGVPIEKVYNQTQRKKFRWAIEMTEPDFIF